MSDFLAALAFFCVVILLILWPDFRADFLADILAGLSGCFSGGFSCRSSLLFFWLLHIDL